MKLRFLLLTISLFGFAAAKANAGGPGEGKKDELNGIVIHSESKKPLKDVSVTAILVYRKEKVVIKTDEAFQMNIEMIESSDYEIMPSPFSFAGIK